MRILMAILLVGTALASAMAMLDVPIPGVRVDTLASLCALQRMSGLSARNKFAPREYIIVLEGVPYRVTSYGRLVEVYDSRVKNPRLLSWYSADRDQLRMTDATRSDPLQVWNVGISGPRRNCFFPVSLDRGPIVALWSPGLTE